MEYAIKHLFHIDTPKSKVFRAVSTVSGLSKWWTKQTNGDDNLGGKLRFNFGETAGPETKIIEYKPDDTIVWECVTSPHGWKGHRFIFLLDKNEGKTRVRFTHEGWQTQEDFYASCNFSWGRYPESLRQYCQTRNGNAFGS